MNIRKNKDKGDKKMKEKEQRQINQKIALTNSEIIKLLKKIEENLIPAYGNNNWGHVGETNEIKNHLNEIVDFIT